MQYLLLFHGKNCYANASQLRLYVHSFSFIVKNAVQLNLICEPGSVAGIVTELRAERSGVPTPVGARFSAPVQTGPGAHPASCAMGTGSLLCNEYRVFPWVK